MKLIRTNSSDSGLTRISDFDEWFRSPFAGLAPLSRLFNYGDIFGGDVNALATDIHEDKDNYFARFELPGVKKEDVKVELNDRILTVTAAKKEKRGDEEASYTFTRSISVPDSVKQDGIGAKLEDGILTVTLPKSEERKPKTITVA